MQERKENIEGEAARIVEEDTRLLCARVARNGIETREKNLCKMEAGTTHTEPTALVPSSSSTSSKEAEKTRCKNDEKGPVLSGEIEGGQDATESNSEDVVQALMQKGVIDSHHMVPLSNAADKEIEEIEKAQMFVSASNNAIRIANEESSDGQPSPTKQGNESAQVAPPTSLAAGQHIVRPGAFAAFPSFHDGYPPASRPGSDHEEISGRTATTLTNSNNLSQDQPFATTARLVAEEEDHAKQLSEELERIKAAPTAEVVRTGKDRNWHRWMLAILVIAVVVLAVVLGINKDPSSSDSLHETTKDGEVETDLVGTVELQPTLQSIKERGVIRCYPDAGELKRGKGVSIDLCRALSAAIFDGDPSRTEFKQPIYKDSWDLLDTMKIDVTTAMVTFNMRRDVYETYSGKPKSFSTPWFFTGVYAVLARSSHPL